MTLTQSTFSYNANRASRQREAESCGTWHYVLCASRTKLDVDPGTRLTAKGIAAPTSTCSCPGTHAGRCYGLTNVPSRSDNHTPCLLSHKPLCDK